MSPLPARKSAGKSSGKSPLAQLHSPAVMLLLIFLLVIYLVYMLAENFGIEGEGGWLGEVLSATLFIAGIIVAAALLGGVFLGLKTLITRRRGVSPWMDDDQTQ